MSMTSRCSQRELLYMHDLLIIWYGNGHNYGAEPRSKIWSVFVELGSCCAYLCLVLSGILILHGCSEQGVLNVVGSRAVI